MWGDPHAFAESLGITICCSAGLPFVVGSGEDFVVYLWDDAAEVRIDRAWRGVAQAMLTRSGVEWSEQDVTELQKKLSTAHSHGIRLLIA
jgi:hypothetical protein